MKLYEIPNKSKLKVRVNDDPVDAPLRDATFHHVDGMYSLCTLAGSTDEGYIFHLYAMQEMVKVGDHYELAKES